MTSPRRAAADLLAKTEMTQPPVPVADLARSVGATLRVGPLERELSGFLLRRGRTAIIGVNSLHARSRQRVTIGHEIGHLLLHQSMTEHVDRGITFYFRDERSSRAEVRQEIEANQFAAELLMPKAMIDAIVTGPVDVHDDDLLEDLASRFDVSVQALTYRLTNLGLSFGHGDTPRRRHRVRQRC